MLLLNGLKTECFTLRLICSIKREGTSVNVCEILKLDKKVRPCITMVVLTFFNCCKGWEDHY